MSNTVKDTKAVKNQFVLFIKSTLSEDGVPSCKRVCAVIAYLASVFVTIYLAITTGASQIVETLTQTLVISATALLGIYNVTGIFKK